MTQLEAALCLDARAPATPAPAKLAISHRDDHQFGLFSFGDGGDEGDDLLLCRPAGVEERSDSRRCRSCGSFWSRSHGSLGAVRFISLLLSLHTFWPRPATQTLTCCLFLQPQRRHNAATPPPPARGRSLFMAPLRARKLAVSSSAACLLFLLPPPPPSCAFFTLPLWLSLWL